MDAPDALSIDIRPPLPSMNPSPRPLRAAALTAGFSLLLMAILSAVANFGVIERLVTPGDAARTVQQISGSQGLFRVGIAFFVLVVVLDVIVAVALLILFEGVNRLLSTLTACFRLAYAAVFLVAISQLLVALPFLDDNPAAAMGGIGAFHTIWHVGLVLFAIHLLLLGFLAYRSGFVPRIFGVLLLIAGVGYFADGVGEVLVADYSADIASFTFLGEVTLIFWLLLRGRRITTA